MTIFNNTLIEYFCDGGASKTVISENAYKKIKEEAPETKLENYVGRPLKSANGKLKILGKVKICLMYNVSRCQTSKCCSCGCEGLARTLFTRAKLSCLAKNLIK